MAFLDETGLQTLWTKIKNTFALKTHSHSASQVSGLATVASTGSYNDLLDKPTIPEGATVDSVLNSSSTNPVQNKVINSALATKVTSSEAVNAVSAAGYTTSSYVSTYVSGATVASAGNATNLGGSAASVYAKASDYLPLSGGTLSGDITVKQSSANATVWVDNGFTDSKAHKGALYTNTNGAFGIYDTTKQKWLLISDSAGNVTMSGNATTATNASSLGGLTSAGYVQTGNVNQTVSGTKSFVEGVSASYFRTSSTANPMLQCTWSDVDITASSRSAAANKLHTCILDKNGVRFGGIESTANTDGSNEMHYTMRNHANTAWVNDYHLKTDTSGNTSAIINNNLYCKSYIHVASSLYVDNGYIYATDSAYTKGTKPSSDNYLFQVLATDKNGNTAAYRLGAYQVYVDSSGNVCNEVSVYKNVSGSTATGARLRVWYISSTDTGYATINDHPAAGDSSYKLATTGWVTNATVKSAGSAGTITTTLPVSKGGTGATTLASAGIATKVGISTQTYASATARHAYYEVNLGGTKYQVAYGRISVSSAGTTSVTFANAFNAAPFVVATAAPSANATGSGNNLSVLPGIATTTNCPLLVRKQDGNAITAWVNYVAIGTGK